MQEPLVITVPMPVNAANPTGGARSRNFWTIARLKKKYFTLLDAHQAAGLIPPPPSSPLPKVTVRSVMHLGGAMDDDNAVARHKSLLDWLKSRGYIVDDRRKCLRWEAFPEQIVKRDGNYRIVLTLTPVEVPTS